MKNVIVTDEQFLDILMGLHDRMRILGERVEDRGGCTDVEHGQTLIELARVKELMRVLRLTGAP